MSTTFSEITNGLLKAVANGGFTLPIHYEAIRTENVKTAFIRCTILPNLMEYSTLGDEGCDLHRGILQLDVFYPNNKGLTEMLTKVDEINTYFYSRREFAMDNLSVFIDKTSILPRQNADGFIIQPVSIEYYAYSPRVTV